MSTVPGQHPLMPHCQIPGLSISPVQVITGRAITVLVARAVNRAPIRTEVNERACMGEGLLAVATWPQSSLAPGEQTELYLAVKRPGPRAGNARPSVIYGGSP
jgi:conjugal transfer pilus assembly protein TraK